jgi:hypothetical protein
MQGIVWQLRQRCVASFFRMETLVAATKLRLVGQVQLSPIYRADFFERILGTPPEAPQVFTVVSADSAAHLGVVAPYDGLTTNSTVKHKYAESLNCK